jgi:type IV secretory pathway VirB10-like protein
VRAEAPVETGIGHTLRRDASADHVRRVDFCLQIMPNGRGVVLERQPGADPEGYAGLEDEVDNHWGMLFKAAILSTILSVGSEAGTSNNQNQLVQALRQGASDSISQTGRQVVQRSLNVQPTITIRPGFPVRVLVTHDLVLEPYPT